MSYLNVFLSVIFLILLILTSLLIISNKRKEANRHDKYEIYINIAKKEEKLGNYERALQNYHKALQNANYLSEEQLPQQKLIELYMRMGLQDEKNNDYDSAIDNYNSAIKFSSTTIQKDESQRKLIELYIRMGQEMINKQDHESANHYYDLAKEINQEEFISRMTDIDLTRANEMIRNNQKEEGCIIIKRALDKKIFEQVFTEVTATSLAIFKETCIDATIGSYEDYLNESVHDEEYKPEYKPMLPAPKYRTPEFIGVMCKNVYQDDWALVSRCIQELYYEMNEMSGINVSCAQDYGCNEFYLKAYWYLQEVKMGLD